MMKMAMLVVLLAAAAVAPALGMQKLRKSHAIDGAKIPDMSLEHLKKNDNDLLTDSDNPLEQFEDKKANHGATRRSVLVDQGHKRNTSDAEKDVEKNTTDTDDATSASNDTANETANATNATENSTDESSVSVSDCVTRKDKRVKAWFAKTSPEGTPCVFGADLRDEGSHCVQELEYGSYGWCFTKADKSAWGSCAENCPLSGHAKVLGTKLEKLTGMVKTLKDSMTGTASGDDEAANATGNEDNAKDMAANAADADAKGGKDAPTKGADDAAKTDAKDAAKGKDAAAKTDAKAAAPKKSLTQKKRKTGNGKVKKAKKTHHQSTTAFSQVNAKGTKIHATKRTRHHGGKGMKKAPH